MPLKAETASVQSAGIAADWVISLVSGYPVERGENAGGFEAAEAAARAALRP